jgi:hypothetical protein
MNDYVNASEIVSSTTILQALPVECEPVLAITIKLTVMP